MQQRFTLFERIVNRRSWYFFACLGFYLLGSLMLRFVLYELFVRSSHHSPWFSLHVLATGVHCDAAVALCIFAPFALWLQLVPTRVFVSTWHRVVVGIVVTAYLIGQLFMFVVEFEFFDEFNSRFNTVAVDYLIYPQEVFVNIWQSYPVVKILSAVILAGAVLSWLMHQRYRRYVDAESSLPNRLVWVAIYIGITIVALALQVHEPGEFNGDRVVYEIALNGSESFFDAAVTRELYYPAFYRTLLRDDAFARTRKLVQSPNATLHSGYDSIERSIPGAFPKKPKNLVLILVESFGSEFWGSLGRKEPTLTPEMDALSKEGLLFTNLYASGNRTVRGMEGVLASFPPLPGDSVVKRAKSDNVSTIARTLKSLGYHTLFIYGGRGVFDGMRSFTMRNGYDHFIEQKDFPNPTFTTIWGVCDEDSFHRGIEEMRTLHKTDKPFFVTFLTVSNHKPYTYPRGRIAEDPDQRSRANAVKYTDWALGEFFRLAKKEGFYNDTIFMVVADHGARVYGSQKIPIPSYKIPLLVVSPLLKTAARVDVMGGSLDVGPTALGLLGLPYHSVFFGQDLLKKDPATAWAVMHHNRDIGFYRNNRLVVLGMNKTADFYQMSGDATQLELATSPAPGDDELLKDATALFQVADDLYTNEKYHLQ